ncbi:hypothetical protein JW992_14215 [candidate division KSB1 bacterium]|nr:hypothetical protein [candidate division KSB1 bacterium]
MVIKLSIVFLAGLFLAGPLNGQEYGEFAGCTGLIAAGNVTESGHTLVGQNWDALPYPQIFGLRMTLDPETGIKVIWDARFRKVPRLNSAGVLHTQNYRSCRDCWTAETGNKKTLYGKPGDEIMSKARSAEEAVALARAIADSQGVRSSAGGAKVYADADGVYMIEGHAPGVYEILGPWRNVAIAHSNAYLSAKMKEKTEYWPAGVNRMLRAQELLDARANANTIMGLPGGNISSQYFMSILRDHVDGFNWVNGYGSDGNNRSIANWGSRGRTVFAIFGELPPEHRDVLSILWSTPNYPPFSPFLPFFIGLSKIPDSFAVGEKNQTRVFVELVNVLRYNLDYTEAVEKFWRAFDDETVRQLSIIRREVIQALASDDRSAATRILDTYVDDRCLQAVDYARALTEEINSRGLIRVQTRVFREILEPAPDTR